MPTSLQWIGVLLLISMQVTTVPASDFRQVVDDKGRTIITNVSKPPSTTSYREVSYTARTYTHYIRTAAKKYRLNERLIHAMIIMESGYNPRAVSPKGAKGLMQLMPGTARLMGVTDVFNPKQNIEGGSRYLRLMLNTFNGNLDYALAAYNAGPEAVKRYKGIPPYRETRNYVRGVKRLAGLNTSPAAPPSFQVNTKRNRTHVQTPRTEAGFHRQIDKKGRVIFTNVPVIR